MNQRTETNFSAEASGGGGSIHGATIGRIDNGTGAVNGFISGSIAPINFNYSGGSVTYNEIWLDDAGVEFTIELLQTNIRSRTDNTLTVVFANTAADDRGFIPLLILNHETRMYEIFLDGSQFLWLRYGEDIIERYRPNSYTEWIAGAVIGVMFGLAFTLPFILTMHFNLS